MSSDSEAMKKKMDEDRKAAEAQQNLKLENEKKQRLLAEEAARLAASNNQPAETQENKNTKAEKCKITTKPADAKGADWQKIIDDYKQNFPNQSPIKDNTLVFNTMDEAIGFFDKQAKMNPPRKFLITEVDQEGKETGFHMYSCGNGVLYKGTLSDIQTQLKAAPQDENVKAGLESIARHIKQDHKSTLNQMKEAEKPTDPKKDDTIPDEAIPYPRVY